MLTESSLGPVRIVITGSRDWTDQEYIRTVVDTFPKRSLVIVGGARGADQIAEGAARIRGHEVDVMRAKWRPIPGGPVDKTAGFDRNLAMLDREPHLVVAFWVGASKGTRHTIVNAMKRGIPLEMHWRPAA